MSCYNHNDCPVKIKKRLNKLKINKQDALAHRLQNPGILVGP